MKTRKNHLFLATFLFTLVSISAGCSSQTVTSQVSNSSTHAEKPPIKPVQVTMKNAQGVTMGTAVLSPTAEGTRLSVEVSGLKPGAHGIHFHEFGKCEPPDFKTAGGHLNPMNKQHGLENPLGPHAGDLPNLQVGADGKGKMDIVSTRVRLGKGTPNALQKEGGTSLIIHEGPDDQKTDPSGNSGARLLCGVIPAL